MEILQIIGFALIGAFMAMLLKEQKPNFSFFLVIFVSAVIFLFLVDKINRVIETIQQLAASAEINTVYLMTILKIIGIAYIAEFAAQISKDAEQNGIAARIELAGKIIILTLAIPILTAIIESIMQMIPT